METKKTKKNIKFTTIAWIMGIMLLVIIIPVNILVSVFDIKLDLTENNLYSLTDTTKNYLSNLEQKVDFFFLMDMDELKTDKETMALANILEEYSSYDCINFKAVDPNTHPEIREELNPNGYLNLSIGDIIVRCGENKKRVPAEIIYSNKFDEDNNVIGEDFNGENYITGAIKSVVEGIMPSIYFLTGHGEKTLESDYTLFRLMLENNNYRAKDLNLANSDAVPEDAAIIIAAAPKKDITAEEKSKLEDFLDKGGNLSLLMSPNPDDIDYANIVDIMHQYCIDMNYDIIRESDSAKHVSGDENHIVVNLVDLSQSTDPNIDDLTSKIISESQKFSIIPYMHASRSFTQYEGQTISDMTITPLIETYDTAVSTPYGGASVNNESSSGYLYLGAYSMDRIRNRSKIVVMGNAEFMDDENISQIDSDVVLKLYLSTITWMYNSDFDMSIPSKTDKNDYMTLMSQEDTNAMMIILNVAPAVVALSGIFVWLKRRHA